MKRLLLGCAACCSALLFTQSTYAAAFQFYELGAPSNGTANVGQAAIASDASTAYFNPAGMAHLPDSEFMLGAQSILTYTNFSPNSTNTITGGNGGNAGGLIPGSDAYFVYNYSPQLKVGASLTTPYGGSLNYNNFWVGRYYVQQMQFYTLNLNPAIAYQVNPWLAVGAGLAIEYANLYQTVAIPIGVLLGGLGLGGFDGQATVKADNTSPGFNLGVLMTPQDSTRIGVAYRSQIVHNLRGNVSFINIGITPEASTRLVMPANIIASLSQALTHQFTFLAELGWANWSTMTDSIIDVEGLEVVNRMNWHDTYRVGLGGQYQWNTALQVQAGASYDSSPTNSNRRLPDLPMDRQFRFGLGINYALLRAVHLGLSYEYINLGPASIYNVSDNGVFSGSYARDYANVVQVSLNVNV